MAPRFVFIIPSYNNAEWVKLNLDSVCAQKYPHWRAIYVDDASTDGTLASARRIAEGHGKGGRFTFIGLKERRRQAHARYIAYNHESCTDPEEIAILLDGDDWLAHAGVLDVLAREYTRHNLCISYGQFYCYRNGRLDDKKVHGVHSYPSKIIAANDYRLYRRFITQHLRTVRVGLLQKIPREDLQYEGEWIHSCTDVAEMMCVLELSEGRHRNIGEPLLVYNVDNSLRYPQTSYFRKESVAYSRKVLARIYGKKKHMRS